MKNKGYLINNIIDSNIGFQEPLNTYEDLINYFSLHKDKNIIKFGIDPSSNGLHFGHIIILNFLDYISLRCSWLKIYIVLGTFTVKVGDPSGRIEVRKNNKTQFEFIENTKIIEQTIKKLFNNHSFIFKYNHQWLDKIDISSFLKLSNFFDVRDVFDRKEFKNRKNRVKFNEIIYPIFQSYDSIVLKNHIEVGGIDQLFNFKNTRTLQQRLNITKQHCIFFKLLVDDKGVKLGKSHKNSILFKDGINVDLCFEKIMLLDDRTIVHIHNALYMVKNKLIINSLKDKMLIGQKILYFFLNLFTDKKINLNFISKNIKKDYFKTINIVKSTSLFECLKTYIFSNKTKTWIKKYIKYNHLLHNKKKVDISQLHQTVKHNDKISISDKKKIFNSNIKQWRII